MLLGVKCGLDGPLVNEHLTVSSLTLFASKLIIVLGFFDLVHGGSVREILDLPWRDSFLLIHPLHSLSDGDVLLDTEFVHILVEGFHAVDHIIGIEVKFTFKLVLVDSDFPVVEV